MFLIVSLLCTSLQEAVAASRGSRSKMLVESVVGLLTGTPLAKPNPTTGFFPSVLRFFERKDRAAKPSDVVNQLPTDTPAEVKGIAKALIDHPMLDGLAKPGQAPSYIPARTFALCLLDSISKASPEDGPGKSIPVKAVKRLPECGLRRSLLLMAKNAGDDPAAFQDNIEDWYDDFMDRVSGWYKRKVQVVTFFFGLLIAGGLNIDAIEITRVLWKEDAIRDLTVTSATQLSAADPTVIDREGAEKALKGPGLPVGWWPPQFTGALCDEFSWILSEKAHAECLGTNESGELKGQGAKKGDQARTVLLMLLGWIITAFAASFGAPFWFSLLDKLLAIRGAGRRPPRGDQTPERQARQQAAAAAAAPTAQTPTPSVEVSPTTSAYEAELTGDDIEDIQEALGMRGDEVTGRIDEATRARIRVAQERFGRAQTGRLTPWFVLRLRDLPVVATPQAGTAGTATAAP
ncbi:MAG: peptidoglycan-binding protein [Kiloniellales bacterium]|nr:peptidoglycan-binding protein [Kiloniellales bacterium]